MGSNPTSTLMERITTQERRHETNDQIHKKRNHLNIFFVIKNNIYLTVMIEHVQNKKSIGEKMTGLHVCNEIRFFFRMALNQLMISKDLDR